MSSIKNNKLVNKENAKNKGHTKFKPKIHQGTDYLSIIIEPHPEDEYRFICKVCKENFGKHYEGYCENLKGHLSNKQHTNTLKTPQENEKNLSSIKHLDRNEHQSLGGGAQEEVEIPMNQEVVKSIDEVRFKFDLVCFLIVNNLPFHLSQNLLSFIQQTNQMYSSEMIHRANINDNQVTNIATSCIGEVLSERVLAEMINSPYSLSMDLGSDKYGSHYLSISARYFENEKSNETHTKFIGLIKMEESTVGEILYQKVNDFLFSNPNS